MQKELENFIENNQINEILPITLVNGCKINLFYGKIDQVSYKFTTDGILDHIDTWLDNRSWDRDLFLVNCGMLKRFEFKLTSANILLIEKKRENNVVKQLYINQDIILKIINNSGYQISINDKENMIIKKMEKIL